MPLVEVGDVKYVMSFVDKNVVCGSGCRLSIECRSLGKMVGGM